MGPNRHDVYRALCAHSHARLFRFIPGADVRNRHPVGFIELLDSLEQGDRPFVKGAATLLKHWMGKGEGHQAIGGIWVVVTAALAHHLVYAALKPRVIKESVSHA